MSDSKKTLEQIKEELEFAKEQLEKHKKAQEIAQANYDFHTKYITDWRQKVWDLKEEFSNA